MTGTPSRRGLGRGLSALMQDLAAGKPDPGTADVTAVPIETISANPLQPRRQFDPEALAELAASLRERGMLQPIIVRPHPDGDGRYQIVAGERRWRAAQQAELHAVPVLVRDFSDGEMLEVGLIENIQRADLNALEEAQAIKALIDRHGHTQDQVGTALAKSRSHIANLLRLLTLPEPVQTMVRDGSLSAGHARALIGADDAVALARRVAAQGLSVRATETLIRDRQDKPARPRIRTQGGKDADTRALEGDLSATLKMRVSIDHAPHGEGGRLSVTYRDLDQLDRLCRLLAGD